MSQNDSILNALKRGEKLTQLDALYKYGCFRLGARNLGLKEVPALIYNYNSPEERDLHFLIANQFREKTNQQRINEFLAYKQKLSQIEQALHIPKAYANTIFQNEELSRILLKFPIEPGEPVDSYKIIKDITGFTKYEQQCYNIIYDTPEFQRKIDRLYKLGASNDEVSNLYNEVVRLRNQLEAREISLNNATEGVKSLFAALEKKYTKTQKPQKSTKPKPETNQTKPKPKPKASDNILISHEQFTDEHWSQTQKQDIDITKCLLDFVLKTPAGHSIALLRYSSSIAGIALRISSSKSTYIIDFDKLIEKELNNG